MAAHSIPRWSLAILIWLHTALVSVVLYAFYFVVPRWSSGPYIGLLCWITGTALSPPAIPMLAWCLPRLLRIGQRTKRCWAVAGLITAIFLVPALPGCVLFGELFSPKAQPFRFPWQDAAILLALVSPSLFAALAATAYNCRRWLFRADSLPA